MAHPLQPLPLKTTRAKKLSRAASKVQSILETSKDPEASYTALSQADRAAFDAYFLPAQYEDTVTFGPEVAQSSEEVQFSSLVNTTQFDSVLATAAATTKCKGAKVERVMKNSLGGNLWTQGTEGTWCWKGSKVTSAKFGRSWSVMHAALWQDKGQIGKGAGVSGSYGRIWAQRKYTLGTGGWDIQTSTPCVRLSGNASGGYTNQAVCSIY